jgi:serine/threonine protein phosphatase PrpC
VRGAACSLGNTVSAVTTVRVGAATDVGRHRDLNEDVFLVGRSLFAVVDGMGGHAAGDVASRLAADALRGADNPGLGVEDLAWAVKRANEAILGHVRAYPQCRGMGCAVAGVALVESGGQPHWAVFHLGDSRVYLLQGDEFRQVTVDHSEVQELLDAGLLTAAQARVHPSRHVLTRAVGESSDTAPETMLRPAVGGQRVLVTTDGLTSEVVDPDIEEVIRSVADPQRAVDLLVRRALDAGGRDNITVVVVDVDEAGYDRVDADTTTVPRRPSGRR